MNIIILNLIYFTASFLIIFLIYILFVNRKRKKLDDGKKQLDINYMVIKFKLEVSEKMYKKLKIIVSLLNSFIIAFVFMVVINLKVRYIFKLLIAFVILMALTYSLYEIVGRILKKEQTK